LVFNLEIQTLLAVIANANTPHPDGGADIDRYFLHVTGPSGETLFRVDDDGNPNTIDPLTITGGNFQIHPCNEGQ
jgi:hypothetical protein